jgi:DNA-directed RNA polymerase I subunit RPA2
MIPLQQGFFKFKSESNSKKSKPTFYYEILLNGKLVGHIESSDIDNLTKKLRYLKALASSNNNENNLAQGLPKYMEICHVPKIDLENCSYSLYPGLYIFTTPGRMMRPLTNLTTNDIEYIGTMEQCYLHVCIKPEEFVENVIII